MSNIPDPDGMLTIHEICVLIYHATKPDSPLMGWIGKGMTEPAIAIECERSLVRKGYLVPRARTGENKQRKYDLDIDGEHFMDDLDDLRCGRVSFPDQEPPF